MVVSTLIRLEFSLIDEGCAATLPAAMIARTPKEGEVHSDPAMSTSFSSSEDSDGDSYGSALVTAVGCSAPEGYVANATDCDDSRASANPAASETCNGLDDDCDGSTDEGKPLGRIKLELFG